MQTVPLTESLFEGAVSFEHGDGWIKPWRIPYAERALFESNSECLFESFFSSASCAAGVRLRFETESMVVGFSCEPGGPKRLVDLCLAGDKGYRTAPIDEQGVVLFEGLPSGRKIVELWLPQWTAIQVRHLLLDEGAMAGIVPDSRPKWIAYGSSITQCHGAHSPARTWPATAARAMGWNLTCLGYGAGCNIEPTVARMIRDLPADFISLKLGINPVIDPSLGLRTFRPAVIGMVRIIREKHPMIPIAVVSALVCPGYETNLNAVKLSLVKMREEMQEAVKRIADTCGDANLYYINGLDLYGRAQIGNQADFLHPNGDQYEEIGRRFVDLVLKKIKI